ncbi:MAG: SsrA-binding protein, partial [Phycisphaerales bacterium]
GDEAVMKDQAAVGFVSSGGYAHHVGCSVALAYLPTELAVAGTEGQGTTVGVTTDPDGPLWDRFLSLGGEEEVAEEEPPRLTLRNVHIGPYPPAGPHRQHEPTRTRRLLAHKREIRKLAVEVRARGASLVPLKIYFSKGKAKLLVGLGLGRRKADKRQAIAAREAKRDMDRATSRRW